MPTTKLALFASAIIAFCVSVSALGAEPPVLFLAQESGDQPTRLVRFGDFEAQGSPDWSPEGSKIAFDVWRPARAETYRDSHVIVVSANGADPRDLGLGAMPSWSNDGTKLAFTSYEPRGIWTMNADGTGRQLIDAAGWGARWSPDGKTIAYTVYQGDDGQNICLHDVETGQRRFVFDDEKPYQMIYWAFAWSPSSKKICFLGVKPNNEREIATVSVDGPDDHFRVHHRGESRAMLAWHPEEGRILMAKMHPVRGVNRLFTFAADGSDEPMPLLGLPADFAATGGDWSPDGQLIVFTGHPLPAASP